MARLDPGPRILSSNQTKDTAPTSCLFRQQVSRNSSSWYIAYEIAVADWLLCFALTLLFH